MDIVFTSFPGYGTKGTETGTYPAMAVYLLSGALRKRGYNVRIVDPVVYSAGVDADLYREIEAKLIERIKPEDIVCISSNTFNWAIARIAIFIIKKKIGATVVLGGLHPSVFFEDIMQQTPVDYIIRGEGDSALGDLIDRIVDGRDIGELPGISYRKNGAVIHNQGYNIASIEEMEEYPEPMFEMLPEEKYNVIPIETSRGCLFSCAFCSIPFRNKRRIFKDEIILQQIEYCKKYSRKLMYSRQVNLLDDCFSFDSERVQRIIAMFSNDTSGFRLSIEARINDLLKDDLVDMLSSECIYNIQIGVECGYDRGLKLVGKGTDIQRLYRCAEKLYNNGLSDIAFFSFIIGFPWEGEDEINQTLDTIQDICTRFNATVSLNWLIMLPSRLYDRQEEYGMNISSDIYGKLCWYCDKDIFYKTHPSINEKVYRRTEFRINEMQLNGLKVWHEPMIFNFADRMNDKIEEYMRSQE